MSNGLRDNSILRIKIRLSVSSRPLKNSSNLSKTTDQHNEFFKINKFVIKTRRKQDEENIENKKK